MTAGSRAEILTAMQRCLEPIAEFLLRAGVSYEEFEDLAKAAFVETAFRKFGVRGRATNISRVAVITGLSRKEISRIRQDSNAVLVRKADSSSPAALVLAGWHTDERFVDENGRPLALPFESGTPTFSDLVKLYAGDVTPGSVRSELKRAGAVSENSNRELIALKRYFVPAAIDDKLASSIGSMLYGLAATIAHNSNPNRTAAGRIQRFVFSDSLGPSAVRLFRNVARQRSEQFVETLDDWLASNQGLVEHDVDPQESDRRRVGVGVYYFEEDGSGVLDAALD